MATPALVADLTLTWSDNSDNEDGFRIERSLDGVAFAEIATVEADTETYADSDLDPDTEYWYRVRAYNQAGNSGYSNPANAVTGSDVTVGLEVQLLSPLANDTFEPGESITVTAVVSDPDRTARAELLVDGAVIGTDANAPYIFLWSGAETGSHTVQVRAIDLEDAAFLSPLVTISVQDVSGPIDPPPPGVYRGSFSSPVTGADESGTLAADPSETGRFTVWIDPNGSMHFLGFDQTTGAVFSATGITLNTDGSFVVVGTAGGEAVVVRGRIDAKGLEGTVDGTDLILAGGAADPNGESGPATGFYEAFGVGTADTSALLIVGGDGMALVSVVRDGVVEVAEVSVVLTTNGANVSGDSPAVEVNLDLESGIARGILSVEGGVEIHLLGLRSDIAASRRLENISTRGTIAANGGNMITGFVVTGNEAKSVLIRAIGPGLEAFGAVNAVQDPVLKLVSEAGVIATNRRWAIGNVGSLIETVSAAVGAFPLDPDSRDAALLVYVAPGRYTAVVDDESLQGGITLIEIYDATGDSATGNDVSNLSTRGQVSAGKALVGGFVVSGNAPKRVLIRGIGPAMGNFGVVNGLSETRLILTQRVEGADVEIGRNTGWGTQPNAAAIAEATDAVGAFALDPGSEDSALLYWLEPGVYTATVQSPSDSASGLALIEVYQTD